MCQPTYSSDLSHSNQLVILRASCFQAGRINATSARLVSVHHAPVHDG